MQASRNPLSGPPCPRPRVLHLASRQPPLPVLPNAASLQSSLGAEGLPEESRLAALGTSRRLALLTRTVAGCGRARGPASCVLYRSRWPGRAETPLGRHSAQPPPASVGHLPSGQGTGAQARSRSARDGLLSRLGRARPAPSAATCLRLCGWLARRAWILCSACCPPPPPTHPRTPQGPRDQLPLGEGTGVGAQCCRGQSWGPGRWFPTAPAVGSRQLPGLPAGGLIRSI